MLEIYLMHNINIDISLYDFIIVFILTFVIELIIGDPYNPYHLIRFIGRIINTYKNILYKKSIIRGCLFFLAVIISIILLFGTILIFSSMIGKFLYMIVILVIMYQCIALKALKDESMKVYVDLKNDNINKARYDLSMIVGRDTNNLDDKQVASATIETIAENFSDGVIAPLFFIFIIGPLGGVLYKTINTLDSMVGYKDDKYLLFGKISAKMDDIFNFIPARISAVLIILSSIFLAYNYKNAIKVFIRDRNKSASPNSGQTEAAMAGALNVKLLGPAYYKGILHNKEYINNEAKTCKKSDILSANAIIYLSTIIFYIFCIIIMEIRIWFIL